MMAAEVAAGGEAAPERVPERVPHAHGQAHGQAQARSRRMWARKLSPAQIRVVAERYFAGGSVQDLMREFGIGRSSLYRYIEQYKTWPDVTNDATHWRIECQRIKNLVVDIAQENRQLLRELRELRARHGAT